jgi:hypothetical protein
VAICDPDFQVFAWALLEHLDDIVRKKKKKKKNTKILSTDVTEGEADDIEAVEAIQSKPSASDNTSLISGIDFSMTQGTTASAIPQQSSYISTEPSATASRGESPFASPLASRRSMPISSSPGIHMRTPKCTPVDGMLCK